MFFRRWGKRKVTRRTDSYQTVPVKISWSVFLSERKYFLQKFRKQKRERITKRIDKLKSDPLWMNDQFLILVTLLFYNQLFQFNLNLHVGVCIIDKSVFQRKRVSNVCMTSICIYRYIFLNSGVFCVFVYKPNKMTREMKWKILSAYYNWTCSLSFSLLKNFVRKSM